MEQNKIAKKDGGAVQGWGVAILNRVVRKVSAGE